MFLVVSKNLLYDCTELTELYNMYRCSTILPKLLLSAKEVIGLGILFVIILASDDADMAYSILVT